MWIAKFVLRHDCILGNRCRKFNVVLQSYDLNEEKTKRGIATSSLHQLVGTAANVASFVEDLRKDPKTKYVERNENTLFLIETSKSKPVSHFTRRMFFVKPVVIDTAGRERWEVASHRKEELTAFIGKVKAICDEFLLESIKNTKLKDVYFPKVMPKLTDLQKKALRLAVSNGYYAAPKKTNLRELAKLSGVSLATYQRHLQRAESKVMPDVLAYLK